MKRPVLKLTAVTLSAMAVFVISNRNTQAELGDRDVDGVKFPFTIRVSSIEVGNPVSTRTFSEVKLNVALDDKKFNMPQQQ